MFAGDMVDNADREVSKGISIITTDETSHSGSSIESVDSIKKYGTTTQHHIWKVQTLL